jgi:hypothetical protein
MTVGQSGEAAMRKNLLLTVIAVLCSLLVCEGLFRLYEHYALSASMRPTGDVVDLTALNYNDTSVPRKKPAGEFRILDFGDSFCHAIVKYPASYHGVAGDVLARTGVAPKTRLVNFGEPSASFYQYLKAATHWTGLVEADAMVVNVFLGNDITDVALGHVPDDTAINRVFGGNFVEVSSGRKRLTAVPHAFGLRLFDYAYAYALTVLEGHYVLRDIPEPYTHALGPLDEADFYRTARLHAVAGEGARCAEMARGWKGLADLARGLSRLGRERGIKVAIMLSPAETAVRDELWKETAARAGVAPGDFDHDLPGGMARAVVARAAPDVPVLDLTAVFRCAADRGDRDYYPRETHWNVEGNRLAGEALARFAALAWLGAPPQALDGLDPCLTTKTPEPSPVAVDACLTAAGLTGP